MRASDCRTDVIRLRKLNATELMYVHQLVGERRLALDHALEVTEVEIRPVDLAEQLQVAVLDAGHVAPREHQRLGEEIALQVRVPQANGLVELRSRLDLLRERLDLARGDEAR